MKRKLCFILTALIFCTLISGCTGSDNEKSSAASSEKASQSEKSNEEQSKVIDKSIFDEKKIVLTFAAMSDIHQNGDTNSIAVKKFKSALKQLKIGYDLDLILVAGDMTDSGSENQIKQFKSTLQSVYTEAIPLVYSLGNHDGQGGLTAERFQKIYGDAYFNADIDKNSIKSGNRHAVVNGYHFITIETESYYNSNGDCSYSQETKVWLKDQLKLASEQSPEKPIFVATHAMIYNTAYGSTLPGTGTNWYTTELTEILNEYPQAVTFGGHVHHPLNDERSIMQTKFTSLGCGSVSYMAIESGYIQTGVTTVPNDCQKYSQGIVAQVDEKNNVRFTRMDFYNNSTIKEAWVISSPSAKNHLKEYTPERADKNEAPSFGVNPEFAFTSDISGYKCNLNVSFPAASDDDMVHHYEIEVSIDGKVFKTYKLLSGFYLVPTTDKMAKKLVANLEALPTAKKAEINICAIDSWGAKSTPITYSLTTPGNPEISVPDADTKSKIYASIEFSADGKYTDKFSKLLLTNVGADISVQKFTFGGKECKLPSLNIDAAGESMKAEFKDFTTPKEASEFFSNGFSIEALYVNRAPAATQGILCGTQNGGWGLAESNGTPYFIVSTGGYQSVYASNAADHSALTHVVAVFDTKRNEIRIYINGNVSESVSLSGALKLGEGNTFNGFYIGADISKNGSGGDFKMSDFSIVTANIYSGAVSSDEVEKIYANLLK